VLLIFILLQETFLINLHQFIIKTSSIQEHAMVTQKPATLNVNGKSLKYQADAGTPLLWVLREQLGLTGTKYGCGIAQCGSCTVHIDGAPVRSCVMPASSIKASQKIITIEGLSKDGTHPIQQAWVALDVPQCGFCQSGMIMAAASLIKSKPNPTDKEIDDAMTNICRCGTYNRVRAGIHAAAREMAAAKSGVSGTKPTKKAANALNITHIEGGAA
jgi:isoquinoline 1-oxidoreductase subunit alpha